MYFQSPTNAIIKFTFEGDVENSGYEKGYATFVLNTISTENGVKVGELTVFSSLDDEPITVNLVTATRPG